MNRLEKAFRNLENKGVDAEVKYDSVFVLSGDVEIEISDREIDFNADEFVEGITTVDRFIEESELNRGASKETVDKYLDDFEIKDENLIANIYGFLGI